MKIKDNELQTKLNKAVHSLDDLEKFVVKKGYSPLFTRNSKRQIEALIFTINLKEENMQNYEN